MEKLEIRRRSTVVDYETVDVACWRVDCKDVCPNTELVLDSGVVALVKVDDVTKIMTTNKATVFSLFNPGKTTKLIGGKKPYTNCQITAIDRVSDFTTAWAIPEREAIVGFDEELGIECKIVVYGNYTYEIEDFFAFANAFPLPENGEITAPEVRERLRAQTFAVTSSYLASQITGRTISECRREIAKYCDDLKVKLNKAVDSKGMTVKSVSCSLNYSREYEVLKKTYDGVKAGVSIKGVENQGKLNDLQVVDAAADIDVKLINAHANANRAANVNNHLNGPSVACPRCGQLNTNVNYCEKCGEKFLAGTPVHKNN